MPVIDKPLECDVETVVQAMVETDTPASAEQAAPEKVQEQKAVEVDNTDGPCGNRQGSQGGAGNPGGCTACCATDASRYDYNAPLDDCVSS